MIDIALVTWPNHPARLEYFRDGVARLRQYLTASRHELNWLCSSETERDTAGTWHGDELAAICDEQAIDLQWREGKASLGAGMNAAIDICQSPLIFLVQDDWHLQEPLDLSDGADFLLGNTDVDLLRYNWPGPEMVSLIDHADGWRRFGLDKWPYGDDPHMRRQDFMDKWGTYEEGHHGAEGNMLWRLVKGKANIAAADKRYFGHVGGVTAVIHDDRKKGCKER